LGSLWRDAGPGCSRPSRRSLLSRDRPSERAS
jgi:hypothetical protein